MTHLEPHLASGPDDALRLEMRTWLEAAMRELGAEDRPHELPEEQDVDLRRRYAALLARDGWAGLTWDPEYGGRGCSLRDMFVFAQEAVRANAPDPLSRVGIDIIGPTLMAFSTEAQKARLLPAMRSGEEIWCQGFSEPGAGSDLASLRTRATRVDGGWSLNGQKTWTSFAQDSHIIFVLARTDLDAPPHAGISAFAVDLRAEGVAIHPIEQITGSNEFCEVFFDDVHVPDDRLVGKPGQGWKVAMTALGVERSTNFMMRQLRLTAQTDQLLERVRRHADLVPSRIKDRLVDAYIKCVELAATVEHHHIEALARGQRPGPDNSATKIFWSETFQEVADLGVEIDEAIGDSGAPAQINWSYAYLFSRATTIYSGTSEIQRNIVAERGLGLPR
jgi:alkylation response protein AidB-like acyl-CoA dehydrogenase